MNLEMLTPIVVALGFISTIYINNKNRAVSSQQGIIAIYKEQIEAQKLKLDSMEIRIIEQGNQISKLEQANKEKDIKLAEYLSIFQGRDKQSVELMTMVKSNGEFIKNMSIDMTFLRQHVTDVLKNA